MKISTITMLLAGTALGASLSAVSAYAQDAAAAPPAAPVAASAGAGDDLLGEVVVTATRQADTVNRVPLSISAVSQQSLTNQGIRTANDLQQVVPGMTFFQTGGDRTPQITIRGIGGSSSTRGSQTTGVYLDDTALQRRMVNGLNTGNGAPFPNLFDLERVEVLRGPQGTLYGDSSEGGTIRFITPTPSLTDYSGRVRVDVSNTEHGGVSREGGLALGGPIVEDKLGFRISADIRREGGWIDAKSVYDGQTFARDVNWSESRYLRAALRWEAGDTFTITPALYWGRDKTNDGNGVWGPSPQISWDGGTIYNGATGRFTAASGRPPSNVSNGVGSLTYFNGAGGTVNYYYSAPDSVVPAHTQNAMPWYNWDSNGNGYYRSTAPGDVQYFASPRVTKLFLPSLTLDKDFGAFSVKSITSYVRDFTEGQNFSGGTGGGTRNTGSPYSFGPAHYGTLDAGDLGVVTPDALGCLEGFNRPRAGACYATLRYIPGFPQYADWYNYSNKRIAKTEELRFSSNGGGPLTWVAGGYYSDSKIHMHGRETSDENAVANLLSGLDSIWRGKSYILPQWGSESPPGAGPLDTWQQDVSDRHVWLTEKTWAVFAEANYNITDKLKITVGGRYNNYRQGYQEAYTGLVAGTPPTFVPDPAAVQALSRNPALPNSRTNPIDLATVAGGSAMTPNGPLPNVVRTLFATDLAGCSSNPNASSPNCAIRYTLLKNKETNFTPKAGVSYQFTPTNMAYFTFSKGFRPGGANSPILSAQCVQALADLGLTASPTSYAQDTVTSYEVGNKVRILGGRVQLNSSAFYIDWKNMQYTQTVNCGFDFQNNAGHAVSKGAELQANGRFGNLSLGLNAGYNKATFADSIRANPNDPNSNIVRKKGDNIGGVPYWTLSANAQYDFEIANARGFVRTDFSWSASYQNGSGAELDRFNAGLSNSYNPWTWRNPAMYNLNLRAGLRVLDIDWALYVQNLTNKQPVRRLPGSSANSDSGYLTGTMNRPRTVGLQANYNF